MFAFQAGLLAFGLVAGCGVAIWVRRTPGVVRHRERAAVAFGAGAAVWVGCAVIAYPAPLAWTLIGTVLAIYLPPLLVIARLPDPGDGR